MAVLGKDRLITAAIALPPLAGAVALLPPAWFAVLIALIAAVGQWELYRMHFKKALPPAGWAGCVAGFLLVAVDQPLAGLTLGIIGVLLVRMFTPGSRDAALMETGVIALGLAYVAVLIHHVALLHGQAGFGRWVFFLLLVTWSGDAAAYYTGRTIGRTKLTAISPNKTVEGSLGGIAASVATAYLGSLFVPDLAAWEPGVIGLLLGVAALVGDLVESMFKRGAGIKDSSTLIPAHGGVLDKLDAFLFTAPVLFYYLDAKLRFAGGLPGSELLDAVQKGVS